MKWNANLNENNFVQIFHRKIEVKACERVYRYIKKIDNFMFNDKRIILHFLILSFLNHTWVHNMNNSRNNKNEKDCISPNL